MRAFNSLRFVVGSMGVTSLLDSDSGKIFILFCNGTMHLFQFTVSTVNLVILIVAKKLRSYVGVSFSM